MKRTKKSFSMHDDYHITGGSSQLAVNEGRGDAGMSGTEEQDQKVLPELSSQMDQVVQGLSGVRTGGQVYLVDVRQLEPYPDQPFRQYTPERLQELADDIARVGVLSPILARRKKNKLQILSGHNRWAAARLAGLAQVPVLILDVDDDQAVLVLTGTNLRQREFLLPSEKAFAYKMQMDALKRQGQRVGDDGGPYNAAAFITQQTGDSRMQIHRYIRLAELDMGLLALLDKGKISMTPAVAVSYLKAEEQQEVLRCVREYGASLTINSANRLKEMAGRAELPPGVIEEVLLQTNNQKEKNGTVSIPFDRIRGLLPEGADMEKAEELIIYALKNVYTTKPSPPKGGGGAG